ncbi:hypothetical protein EMIT0P228_130116 [Pseudomonas brassicacearum]
MPPTPWPLPFAMPIPVPACCLTAWEPHAVVAGACVSDSISAIFREPEHLAPVSSAFLPGLLLASQQAGQHPRI